MARPSFRNRTGPHFGHRGVAAPSVAIPLTGSVSAGGTGRKRPAWCPPSGALPIHRPADGAIPCRTDPRVISAAITGQTDLPMRSTQIPWGGHPVPRSIAQSGVLSGNPPSGSRAPSTEHDA